MLHLNLNAHENGWLKLTQGPSYTTVQFEDAKLQVHL